jgi:hypothetical protein
MLHLEGHINLLYCYRIEIFQCLFVFVKRPISVSCAPESGDASRHDKSDVSFFPLSLDLRFISPDTSFQ